MSERTQGRVFSFDLRFRGSKRTSFYRKLFGFSSKTKKEDSKGRIHVYESFYPGLLTSIPHLKLGKSVIAVPEPAADRVSAFFQDSKWDPISLYVFTGIFPSEDRMRAMQETLDHVRVTPDATLGSEIESLLKIVSRDNLDSSDIPRARRVLKAVDELTKLDWTDERGFSRDLREKTAPLRKAVRV